MSGGDVDEEPQGAERDVAAATVEDAIARELGHFGAVETILSGRDSDEPITLDYETLYAGIELGLADLSELMAWEHSRVIAILGAQDSGKTLFLVSLYHMIAAGICRDFGFDFAGSFTLPGFEERARASRRWTNGAVPQQMSVRTQVGDDRSPGFMHVDLLERSSGKRLRLFLSDLPGEWTSDAIDSERYLERLSFLSRADAVIVMVEAERLTGPTKHQELERQRLLIDRLTSVTPAKGQRLGIFASKADAVRMEEPAALLQLEAYARSRGFEAASHLIASISQYPDIESGTGVFEALLWCLRPKSTPFQMAPSIRPERFFGWLPISEGGRL